MEIVNLPIEIYYVIFNFLNVKDIINISTFLSNHFRVLFHECDFFWKKLFILKYGSEKKLIFKNKSWETNFIVNCEFENLIHGYLSRERNMMKKRMKEELINRKCVLVGDIIKIFVTRSKVDLLLVHKIENNKIKGVKLTGPLEEYYFNDGKGEVMIGDVIDKNTKAKDLIITNNYMIIQKNYDNNFFEIVKFNYFL